jgi:hypothetical protein
MTLNLIRRLVKGTPLTAAEHDGNLDKLEDGIEAREPLGAVAAHVAAADPHPGYLTQTEGDSRYRQSATALTDGDIPAGIARDSEVAAAIGAHEAAADPHPGYLTPAEGNAAYVGLSDARLSDARTPTAHKSSHAVGGTDALTPSDIGAATAAQGALAATAVQPGTLGTAAAQNVGTSAGNVVQLDSSARLPAVDGSQLTNLPGGVSSVTGTAPIVSSGGTTPAISISAATTGAAGSMSSADKIKLDGIQTGAQVNVGTDLSYTASSRLLASSTGADVTLPEATTTLAGLQSAADKTRIDQLGADDSPSFTGLTITGTAPVVIPHIHGSIAGNLYVHVKNTSGGPLAAGTAVYATGSVGDTDQITVAACDPTDPLKMPAIGVLETTLANNGDGDAVILGELRPFNTNSYQLGDQLYVGAGGAMVATIPASGEVQQVGSVVRVNVNTGTILVNTGAAMARVGFTGAYGDLSGLPTIPSTYADLGPIGDGIIFTISNRGETATPGTNYDESLPLSFAVTITKVTFITHIDNTGSSTTTLSAYKRTAAGTKTSLLSANATLASGASVVVASLSATAGVLSLAAGDRLGVDLVGLGTGASGIKCIIEYTRSAV